MSEGQPLASGGNVGHEVATANEAESQPHSNKLGTKNGGGLIANGFPPPDFSFSLKYNLAYFTMTLRALLP
jgi:hypothetical protein